MNGRTLTLPPAIDALRVDLAQRWNARSVPERQTVAAAAAAIGIVLVWLVAVAPALRTLREAPPQLDRLDSQWQQMQAIAAESRTLRGTAPVSQAQAGAAIQSATDALGAKARVVLQGDRAALTLTGVHADELVDWLAQARGGARARPVEAQLARGPNGYSGSIVVQLPVAGATP